MENVIEFRDKHLRITIDDKTIYFNGYILSDISDFEVDGFHIIELKIRSELRKGILTNDAGAVEAFIKKSSETT